MIEIFVKLLSSTAQSYYVEDLKGNKYYLLKYTVTGKIIKDGQRHLLQMHPETWGNVKKQFEVND